MKVLPFEWEIKAGIPFSRYQPVVLIAFFNHALFVMPIFFGLYFGQRRALLCLVAFVSFAVVVAPWLAGNFNGSGTVFGTAGYAIVQNALSGDRLERSLMPHFGDSLLHACLQKLLLNVG